VDYNITGRADFENGAVTTAIHLHHPGVSNVRLNLADNQIIAASKLVVSCIAGYSNGVPFPPEPCPEITIPGLIDNVPCGVGTAFNYNPYKVPGFDKYPVTITEGSQEYNVVVDSPAFFQINISLRGCLFTCNKGHGMISPTEAIGFAMQNQSNQGEIMLDEAAFDVMNDYIVSAGGPDFRDLPFSLAAIHQLPEVLQYAALQKIFRADHALMQGKAKQPKALPPPDIVTDFLKDATASGIELELKQLKQLANYMIKAGWKLDQ
jgi:hypothetical protein